MSHPISPAGDVIRRRGVVAGGDAQGLDVRWTESRCRGCVGCGGRCGLFAGPPDALARLAVDGRAFHAGAPIDVEVSATQLRQAAMRTYGLGIAGLVSGAVIGHGLGGLVDQPHIGALGGLLAGTFLAGRLTKRSDAAFPVRVRPSPESVPQEPPC